MSLTYVEKAVAYITFGNSLLVFTHPAHPDAGVQVPQGSLEVGEEPVEAAIREAREETGGSVTRNNIIDAAKVCGIDTAASTFGISTQDVCFVVIKGKTRRRRGISAADIRRTRRVINFNKKLTKDLRVRK